jgi:hypothetical protein
MTAFTLLRGVLEEEQLTDMRYQVVQVLKGEEARGGGDGLCQLLLEKMLESGKEIAARGKGAERDSASAAARPKEPEALTCSDAERRWFRMQVTLGALVTLSKAVRQMSGQEVEGREPAIIRQLVLLGVLLLVRLDGELTVSSCSSSHTHPQMQQQHQCGDECSSSDSRRVSYSHQHLQQQQNGRGDMYAAHDGKLCQQQQNQEQQQAVLHVGARLLCVALNFLTQNTLLIAYGRAVERADSMSTGPHYREAGCDGERAEGGRSSSAVSSDSAGVGRWTVHAPASAAAALNVVDGSFPSCIGDAAGGEDVDEVFACSADEAEPLLFRQSDMQAAACAELLEVEKRLLVSPLLGYATTPTTPLSRAAIAYYQILQQMPPDFLKRVERCLEGVEWLGSLPRGDRVAIGKWQESRGMLGSNGFAQPMELLRVPFMLSHALVDALPVEFACNNPDCESLDGPCELGLVSQRAKVVCGGCGVARYCCRKCQKHHWGEHHKHVCCQALAVRSHI